MVRTFLSLCGFTLTCAASSNLFLINSPQTYLRANGETPGNATGINLAANGFVAGQTVSLQRLGQYNFAGPTTLAFGMTAVFSSSNAILPSTFLNRIPGAIDAGPDVTTANTSIGGLSTDIPEDFEVSNFAGTGNGLILTIPVGATTIFASAEDDFLATTTMRRNFIFRSAPSPSRQV